MRQTCFETTIPHLKLHVSFVMCSFLILHTYSSLHVQTISILSNNIAFARKMIRLYVKSGQGVVAFLEKKDQETESKSYAKIGKGQLNMIPS